MVQVGGGRGFVVAFGREHVIITVAHCLAWTRLPPPHPARGAPEVTFPELVGPLGEKPQISVECVFVDLIGDIAVLGVPDDQVFPDEADAFNELVDAVTPFAVAEAPERLCATRLAPGFTIKTFADANVPVRVLSLDGQWLDGTGRRACPTRPAAWLSLELGVPIEAGCLARRSSSGTEFRNSRGVNGQPQPDPP